jgi:hypothetical protein
MADDVSPNACDAEGYAPMCCNSENGVCCTQIFIRRILWDGKSNIICFIGIWNQRLQALRGSQREVLQVFRIQQG